MDYLLSSFEQHLVLHACRCAVEHNVDVLVLFVKQDVKLQIFEFLFKLSWGSENMYYSGDLYGETFLGPWAALIA